MYSNAVRNVASEYSDGKTERRGFGGQGSRRFAAQVHLCVSYDGHRAGAVFTRGCGGNLRADCCEYYMLYAYSVTYYTFQSVRAFGKALKIDPWNRTAASNMADALCSQGKCEEAVEWYPPELLSPAYLPLRITDGVLLSQSLVGSGEVLLQ